MYEFRSRGSFECSARRGEKKRALVSPTTLLVVLLAFVRVIPASAQVDPPEGPPADSAPPAAAATDDTTAEESDRIRVEDIIPPRREDGSRPRIRWKELRELLDRELRIIEAIERLQFGLQKKAGELKKVQWERRRVEIGLRFFAQRFSEETEALAEHRALIRTRLRALRQMERKKTLYLLFASGTYTDYLRRERLLVLLREQDQKRLEAYREALTHFRRSRGDLEHRREQLRDLEQEIYQTKVRIERERREYQELLGRIDQERSYYERYHSELRRLSRLVGRKLRDLDHWEGNAWFEARKGKLAPPIRFANAAIPFGYRVHPRFGTRVLHRGITYRPNARARARGKSRLSVYAIYVGKVVYADWLPGYGRTVILDHTDGFYTLYGHLDRITVEEGEVLKSRERLGLIGKAGSLRRAELYFELRANGRPVNPQPWFKP